MFWSEPGICILNYNALCSCIQLTYCNINNTDIKEAKVLLKNIIFSLILNFVIFLWSHLAAC